MIGGYSKFADDLNSFLMNLECQFTIQERYQPCGDEETVVITNWEFDGEGIKFQFKDADEAVKFNRLIKSGRQFVMRLQKDDHSSDN